MSTTNGDIARSTSGNDHDENKRYESDNDYDLEQKKRTIGQAIGKVIYLLLPVIIIALAGLGTRWMINSKKAVPRKEEKDTALIVETMVAKSSDETVPISGSGTVVAKRKLGLSVDVSGKTTWVNPKLVTGARFKKGTRLCKIDSTDYKATLAAAKANFQQAKRLLTEAQSGAKIAKDEWETSHPGETASPLVLKQPMVDSAQAQMSSAQAAVKQAQSKYWHTTLRAPFDLQVRSKSIEIGQFVGPGQILVQAFGTREAEIAVPLTVDDIALVGKIGAKATIESSGGAKIAQAAGVVSRVIEEIDPQTRTASVVVRISDPYGLKRRAKKATSSTIPIGTFVNVTFDGKTLNKVYKVPSKIIKEEDQVWVEDNGKLVFKAISIAHRANEDVYISSGLKDGDHIIVSNIPTPIEGMHIERTGKQGQQK